jgi:hypothetical protein
MTFLVVPNNLFSRMQAYKRLEHSVTERRNLKDEFLNGIKSALTTIRWNRATKLLKVIDTIIYFATDRGYSFFGRETLAKKCNVSTRTVDKAIRLLKESGEVIVAYRENPNSNGYKTPIILLKRHEHFKYWCELLNIECEVECEVENHENLREPSDESAKKISTIDLPKINYINNNITSLDDLDSTYTPSFINKEFVKTAGLFFNAKRIYQLWLKVLIAYRRYKLERPLDEVIDVVIKAFKETVFLYKQGRIKKTFDGYFYRLLESAFYTEKCRENKDNLYDWIGD